MKNSFLYTVVFTFTLCFLFVLILSFTYEATKDTIVKNQIFAKQYAILQALGSDAHSKEAVFDEFKKVTQEEKNDITFYKANFNAPAIAKQFSGPGLWGTITGYISFSEDLSQIHGFEIVDQNETPGLGGRISEPWFKEQFKNEKIIDNNIIVRSGGVGDTNKENGAIDGISGATRTSDSIQKILTKEIKIFKENFRGIE